MRAIPTLAFVALTTALFGCQRSTENAALVRFVHAIPTNLVVDLYADDDQAFADVAFRAVTSYRQVDGQRYTLRLQSAGSVPGTPLAFNYEGPAGGDYYTVFAVPGDGWMPVLHVVEDDFSAPAVGRARVRIVHASGDVGALSVYERGRETELFGGVDFQSVTGYDEVDAWSGALDIRQEGQASALATIPDARFEAGKMYTVVVVGNLRTAPKLAVFVIEDWLGVPGAFARN